MLQQPQCMLPLLPSCLQLFLVLNLAVFLAAAWIEERAGGRGQASRAARAGRVHAGSASVVAPAPHSVT